MDKYEFNLRIDQIKKKIASEDFETAMKIADTIDWRRVRNINILSMVSGVYEKNGEYQEAKDILLLAFERAPMGKRLLYKLAELAIKEGSPDEAEDYYREFCELAPEDPRQYILRYLILGAKGAPVEQLIHTLEQYCNVELDEKWLYELAELYNAAHMEQLCVMTCDKIMLMFGTGKYVDKAIDLKVQYAPLTDYQMDLVENKDKYEARLKAVETEYNKKKPMVLPIDEEDAQAEQEAEDAYVYQQEAAYTKEPEPEEKVLEEQPETVFDDEETGEEEAFSNAVQEPEEEQELSCEEEESEADSEPEVSSEPEVVSGSSKEDETLRAQLHEAEAQEDLAKEMSRLAEEHGYSEETQAAQTQVLADIRHLKKGPMYSGSNHLMIEADEPEKGFELAVKTLKRIHQETGAKNQAAKITGARLNNRGIFTLSDKLTGKDLIIEQAGDMNESILQELNQLMARDETGMSVVLIDTAERLEELHKTYPGLAKRFECIGSSAKETVTDSEPDRRPVRAVKLHEAPAATAPARMKTTAEPEETEGEADDDILPSRPAYQAAFRPSKIKEEQTAAASEKVGSAEESIPSARPAAIKRKQVIPLVPEPPVQPEKEPVSEAPEPEMDIDDFAKYACEYAGSIDCSISGKSMLALYERIEIMEEDGEKLTKAAAEALIEEAADKAENPSLFKKMTGLFSSKYDKAGLLILKEEHFI